MGISLGAYGMQIPGPCSPNPGWVPGVYMSPKTSPSLQEIPGDPNHTSRNVPGQFSGQLSRGFSWRGVEICISAAPPTSSNSHVEGKWSSPSPRGAIRYGETLPSVSGVFSSQPNYFSYFNSSSKHKTHTHARACAHIHTHKLR